VTRLRSLSQVLTQTLLLINTRKQDRLLLGPCVRALGQSFCDNYFALHHDA
jgi:hypothetical protein